jgi:DNA-binding transcriptional regulator YhcF (GntR family)
MRDQLVTQLELQILTGRLRHGQRLPSVRMLARRLDIHHNTVSAAYRDLEASGRVVRRRGAGMYVCFPGPASLDEAASLQEMIRVALDVARSKGFGGTEIRQAVERWLRAAPPDRVVIVGRAPDLGQLLAHELRSLASVPVSSATFAEVGREPGLLAGALAVLLPFHAERLRRLAPDAAFEIVRLTTAEEHRAELVRLPAGSVLLVVSHARDVLDMARRFLHGLRGDELLVETRLLSAEGEWRRLVSAADVVLADGLALPRLGASGTRRLLELRLVGAHESERLRAALRVSVPGPLA